MAKEIDVYQSQAVDRGFKGVWIPANLWLSNLSLQEKHLIVEIDSLSRGERGCFKSNKELGRHMQLSASRVSSIISGLCEKGLIRVDQVKSGKQCVERRIFMMCRVEDIGQNGLPNTYFKNERGIQFPKGGISDSVRPPFENSEESNTLSNTIEKTHITSIPAEVDQHQPETEIVKDMFGSDDRKTNDKVCPWEEILDIWAEVMPDKPQPARNLWVGTARAADLSNRWKACFSIKHEQTGKPFYTDKESGLDWWRRFFTYLRKSDWLMGRVVGANGTAFRNMKIDWIVKKGNFVKILENTYHR